jgi:ABC-2 type transport system ATP-binding protein
MRSREFVRYAAWLKEAPTDDASVDAALAFADVERVADERLGALSVGTLRRVGLAASVVHRPSILVLDEPTAGLDPMQRSTFHERIRALAEDTTVVLATHLLEDANALAGRMVIIEMGRVVWSGGLQELSDAGDAGLDGTERLRSAFVSIVQGAKP